MLTDPYLGHLWSLAVEEQFYIVWPLLVWLLRPRALAWTCASMLPLSLAIRLHYAGQSLQANAFVNTFTPASLDSLACGALIALAIRHPAWRARLARAAVPVMLLSSVCFGILAWRAGTVFIYQPLIQTWGITALTFLFGALIFIAATEKRGVIAGLLNLSALEFTGKISYGLYVLHPLVYALVVQELAAVPVPPALDLALNSEKIILVAMASIVVAAGSWFYFEKPILGLKRKFRYSRSSITTDLAGSTTCNVSPAT
jgi:peptidoglycan/LPS O-acetylase OafA/YrhL